MQEDECRSAARGGGGSRGVREVLGGLLIDEGLRVLEAAAAARSGAQHLCHVGHGLRAFVDGFANLLVGDASANANVHGQIGALF